MAADAAWARQYRKHGFNMIATGTDQGILMAGIRSVLQSVGERHDVQGRSDARSHDRQRAALL